MTPLPLPDGALVYDTASKPTPAQYLALAQLPEATRPAAVARYVGLRGPAPGDIDAAELQAIHAAGLGVLLVQHCCAPGWRATPGLGARLGAAALACAQAAGYAPGCHLALDLEGCADSGAAVAAEVNGWCEAVRVDHPPLLYCGYAAGLTPAQEYELACVDRYWGAAGNWGPAVRGVALRQRYPSVVLAGVTWDANAAEADALGGRVMVCGP